MTFSTILRAVPFTAMTLAIPVLAQAQSDFRPAIFAGTVVAKDLMGLSFEARGCIVSVSEPAKDMGFANAGQTLVELDDQQAKLAVATALARVKDLEAAVSDRELSISAARADELRRAEELDFVAKEFERSETMFRRGLINESTMEAVERRMMDANFAVDRAKEALASAEAAKNRAEIALDIGRLEQQTQELNYSKLVVTAPFDGVLLGLEASVGDCVQDGAQAAQIYANDQKSVEVFVRIDQLVSAEATGVAVDGPVDVIRVNGDVCPGHFTWIGTEANLETQYIKSTIDVDASCAAKLFLNEAVEVKTVPNRS